MVICMIIVREPAQPAVPIDIKLLARIMLELSAERDYSKRNLIRAMAFRYGCYLTRIESVKKYYDDPDYPSWHGGFIEAGLIDAKGMFGYIEQYSKPSREDVFQTLSAARKLYFEHFCKDKKG